MACVLTNAPIVDVQRKKGFGVKFATAMSKIIDQVIGLIFVDDAHIVEGNLRSTTDDLEEVTERMQNSINCWEGSLKDT